MQANTGGFRACSNDDGWTVRTMAEKLGEAQYSFGEPKIRTVGGRELIIFEPNIGHFQVYINVKPKKIEVSYLQPEEGVKAFLSGLFSSKYIVLINREAQAAEKAIQELWPVVTNLLETGSAENGNFLCTNREFEVFRSFKDDCHGLTITQPNKGLYCHVLRKPNGGQWGVRDPIQEREFEVHRVLGSAPPRYELYWNGVPIIHLRREFSPGGLLLVGDTTEGGFTITSDSAYKQFKMKHEGTIFAVIDGTQALLSGEGEPAPGATDTNGFVPGPKLMSIHDMTGLDCAFLPAVSSVILDMLLIEREKKRRTIVGQSIRNVSRINIKQ